MNWEVFFMTFIQAALISIMCYLAAEGVPWMGGDFGGFCTFSRPLVSGMVVGVILGDVQTGILVGVAVQAIYLSNISAGGMASADITVVAYPAIALGVVTGGDASISVAIAATLGIVGITLFNAMQLINVFFNQMTVKAAERGDMRGVFVTHVVLPQISTFLLRFVPSFLVLYFGTPYIDKLLNIMPETVLNILSVIGGILPAVGVAMILSMTLKYKAFWIYFLIGFMCITFLGINMIAVSIIGIALAYFNYRFTGSSGGGASQEVEIDDMEVEL